MEKRKNRLWERFTYMANSNDGDGNRYYEILLRQDQRTILRIGMSIMHYATQGFFKKKSPIFIISLGVNCYFKDSLSSDMLFIFPIDVKDFCGPKLHTIYDDFSVV